MSIQGSTWKYGDDINTDIIFPGKYTYTITDPNEMAKHALEDLDPDFAAKVKKNDVIVAGENFGCGSSREQADLKRRFCRLFGKSPEKAQEKFRGKLRIYWLCTSL